MNKDRHENGNKEKHLSDEAIIELYWARNEKAIEVTDQKYGRYLYAIAYNIVHNRLDCEECLNDTYIGAWNRMPPDRPTVLQAFLSKIMRNTAIDRYRKNKSTKRVPSELVSALSELEECLTYSKTMDEELAVRELSRLLNTYIGTLSERAEYIFVCRYFYSDTVSNIAKMLDVSTSTVFKELTKIREDLKKHLEKEGYTF